MIYKLKPNRVLRTYLGGSRIDALRGTNAEDGFFPEEWVASVTAAQNVPGADVIPPGKKQVSSVGTSYEIDVIHRRPAGDLLEHPAKIIFAESDGFADIVDGHLLAEMSPDIADGILYHGEPFILNFPCIVSGIHVVTA